MGNTELIYYMSLDRFREGGIQNRGGNSSSPEFHSFELMNLNFLQRCKSLICHCWSLLAVTESSLMQDLSLSETGLVVTTLLSWWVLTGQNTCVTQRGNTNHVSLTDPASEIQFYKIIKLIYSQTTAWRISWRIVGKLEDPESLNGNKHLI